MMNSKYDVIVVGAGAAGLWAAATVARRGQRVLLIEKNKKLGVKILMSGGTRCNITHNASWREVADAFGKSQGRFLKYALATLTPEEVVDTFHRLGVATKVEETGKVFPQSDRAIDVRDALVTQARQTGVNILPGTSVTGIASNHDHFVVSCAEQSFFCRTLVLTCGGQSYPGCGTTGDGYGWLTELGHSVVAPRPALTPLKCRDEWVHRLSGVTIPDVDLSIQLQNGKPQMVRADRTCFRGSFLFTHRGCSGPSTLNISRLVTDPANNLPKKLICDWLPRVSEEMLRNNLTSAAARSSGRQLLNELCQVLPKRLAHELCELAGIPGDQSLAELGKKRLSRIIQQSKRCPLDISGTLGFAKAEVTAGGIELSEVNPQTMESRLVPRLFLAGEILDVDGPIGGYNFQAAFSTGFVAGNAIPGA